ncbi:related to XAP-5 protein [Rhynchosporium agropyri]|uniref:Related to XAP-5 protein n=1 Tax=Rhynchosporium agropyri TaxID=914238 RepID=A0A1E1K0E5_9HELO|nr:related to XAP-5 protein [Rhynchosporium agropyri]
MASNPPSGISTPNPRFTSQTKTAEDLLSTQTVGLVNLSDYRKRRAEAIEQKERDVQDAILGAVSGQETLSSDGASTPNFPPLKKKKRKAGTPKLSFGDDEEEGEGTDAAAKSNTASPRSGTPNEGMVRRKMGVNTSVGLVPKALTKGALMKEAQAREGLRKEFMVLQEAVKRTEIAIPFVFYDGTNIPGGVCRIKKGDFIWVFLDRSRKVGAELGVGEKVNSRREWAKIGVDDLMLVRGSLIIPHHYDFYYFIINHSKGPNDTLLFDYSPDPPKHIVPVPDPMQADNYNPLSTPSARTKPAADIVDNSELEGIDDDPTITKVVDRRWYERNKHIFPASVWQTFDPEKDYQTEVKRDLGGNAFFFS